MRYKLTLSYEGTNYHGYQVQIGQTTIQEQLEKALFNMTGTKIITYAASRTDQGVHALGQVVHFDSDIKLDSNSWVNALNKRLNPDIKVIKVVRAKDTFHARHDSKSKIYYYTITKVPTTIINQRFESYVPNLDTNLIKQAIKDIIGTHDFIAFGKHSPGKPTVKTIYQCTIKETKTKLVFKIHGNHFLRYMVRSIIGNLIAIGLKQKPADHLQRMLLDKDRKLTAKTAEAKGLLLYKIFY